VSKALANWIAAVAVLALGMPAPVLADIRLQRKVEQPPRKAPAPQRRVSRPRPVAPAAEEPPPPPAPVGIDPELMREAVVEANYKVTYRPNPAAATAVLGVTDGKTGWSVNFSGCTEANRCSTMEFYTLWNVTNEANVCSAWNHAVVRDPNRMEGRPYCYTVASLPRQFHLKLTSSQIPYAGIDRLPREEAKARMSHMIGVWTSHLPRLSEAWTIARSKCPKPADKCY